MVAQLEAQTSVQIAPLVADAKGSTGGAGAGVRQHGTGAVGAGGLQRTL